MKKESISQEEFYLKIIRGLVDYLEKGVDIDKYEVNTLSKPIPGADRLETKRIAWKELRVVFKPKK